MTDHRWGGFFAILAAASNGTLGVLNRHAFTEQDTYVDVSFYRCFGGFLLLSLVLMFRPKIAKETWKRRRDVGKISLLAFFGLFILYFFDTWAFSLTSIPVVSFLTYASGIVAVVLAVVVLKESLGIFKIISIALVFFGIYQLFGNLRPTELETRGALLALISGTGYSIFLFLWRKFAVPGGVATLWWFFLIGSFFLFIPFQMSGASLPSSEILPTLVALILIPTLGGYYFTSRALTLTEASRVQIIETSEPLFASLFAYVFFRDVLSSGATAGAAAILVGIVLLILVPDKR